MKKHLGYFLFVVLFFSALSAKATDYYFDVKVLGLYNKNLSLSQSLSFQSGETTNYYWYTLAADGTTRNYLTEALPDFNNKANNFDIGTSGGKQESGRLVIDTDMNIGKLSLVLSNADISASSPSIKINIDTITSSTYTTGFKGLNTNVVVKDVVINGDNSISFGNIGTAPMGSLKVTGTFNVWHNSTNQYYTSLYTIGVANHSIDNPDVQINILKGKQSVGDKDIWRGMISYGLGNWTDAANAAKKVIDGVSYNWVNKTTEYVGFWVAGAATSKGQMNIVFTNDGDATSNGHLWEGYFSCDSARSFSYKDGGAKLALVMRSSTYNETTKTYTYLNNTQSFTGEKIYFSGGVEMISGTLLLNYRATMSGEEGTAHYDHGVLKLSKAAGAQATTFGSNSAVVGGTFVFSDLVVSDGGGAIRVRMDFNETMDNVVCDTLSFTGLATGAGVVVIDLKSSNGNLPDEMLDFMIDHNISMKVISWSALADSGIEFTTTDEYKTYNFNGQDYKFNATNAADGLYINYIAVPEPATLAALFGALALGFAAWRRRK